MYYVYIITNDKGQIYTGYSSDLKERLTTHNQGKNRSTRGRKWKLIYYEAYKSEQDARKREYHLKKSSQARRWLKERIKISLNLSKDS